MVGVSTAGRGGVAKQQSRRYSSSKCSRPISLVRSVSVRVCLYSVYRIDSESFHCWEFPLLGEGALRRALLRGGSIEATVEALLATRFQSVLAVSLYLALSRSLSMILSACLCLFMIICVWIVEISALGWERERGCCVVRYCGAAPSKQQLRRYSISNCSSRPISLSFCVCVGVYIYV